MGKSDVRTCSLVAQRSGNSIRACDTTVVARYAVDTTAIDLQKRRLCLKGRHPHPLKFWYDSGIIDSIGQPEAALRINRRTSAMIALRVIVPNESSDSVVTAVVTKRRALRPGRAWPDRGDSQSRE